MGGRPATADSQPAASTVPTGPGSAVPRNNSVALKIDWHDEKLSVSAERMPLSLILQEVIRRVGRTRIDVQGLSQLQERASMSFDGVPLREALQRLLSRADYAMQPTTLKNGVVAYRVTVYRDRTSEGGIVQVAENTTAGNAAPPESAMTKARREELNALRDALQDADPEVRAAALEAINAESEATDEETTEAPPASSDDGNSRMRSLQLMMQSASDPHTIESSLANALQDPDPSVRSFAAQALATQSGPQITTDLTQAAHDPDPSVRLAALQGLAQSAGGAQVLQQAVSDPDASVRAAAQALMQQQGITPNSGQPTPVSSGTSANSPPAAPGSTASTNPKPGSPSQTQAPTAPSAPSQNQNVNDAPSH
jgi:hypothetical protein